MNNIKSARVDTVNNQDNH